MIKPFTGTCGSEYFMNSKDKDGNPIRVKLKEVQAEKDLDDHRQGSLFQATRETGNFKGKPYHWSHPQVLRLPNASNFCPAVQGTSQATPGVRSLCVEPRREESERSLR